MENKTVLNGLRVVDFGQYLAGPMAAMILADFGAEVIHIDPPGGPKMDSPANAVLMRGKKNIVLDLKQDQDRKIAEKLIASADVLIENFRPGVMERLGLGAERMMEQYPQLVYCSIPGFSETDAARRDIQGWEGIVSSEAGLYRVSRFELDDTAPVFYSLPVASNFAAFMAVHSIMAALLVVEKCGRGQRVEVPLYDACFEAAGIFGRDPKGKPPVKQNADPTTSFRELQGYPCADGRYVQLSPPPRGCSNMWSYLFPGEKIEAVTPELKERIAAKFREHTMLEWEKLGQEQLKAGVSAVYSSEEWLHDDYALSSSSVIRTIDPVLGEIFSPGYACYLSRTPGAVDHVRHLPDADREEILAGLDAALNNRKNQKNPCGPVPAGALDDIKILDLCQILAGPIAGRIAAEYGARVIKINNPRSGENRTAMAGHDTVNNGKATIFLDLKSEEERQLLESLLREADVFHCNFTPEARRRLRIEEEDIRKINPNIIVSQVNVHSTGGFRGEYRGHEELGEAITGMSMRMSGDAKGEAMPITYCDNATGCISGIAILMALYHRNKTGEGQFVQASLSRSGGYLQLPYMISYKGKVWDEPAGRGIYGWNACNRLYKACDGWFWLAAEKNPERLAAAVSLSGILPAEDAFAVDGPTAKALEQIFIRDSAQTWVQRLKAAGIEARVSRDFCQDAMEEEYAVSRGLSRRCEHRGLGVIRTIGASPRLSLTPNHAAAPVSAPGSDTEEVRRNGWNYSL